MIRAVAATAMSRSRSKHVLLVKQPNPMEIHVKCEHCGIVMVLSLPADIPTLNKFLNKCEKSHANCVKPTKV